MKNKSLIPLPVRVYVEGARGCWRARFKIGVQSFYVCERDTKAEALWFCRNLRVAFNNLGATVIK